MCHLHRSVSALISSDFLSVALLAMIVVTEIFVMLTLEWSLPQHRPTEATEGSISHRSMKKPFVDGKLTSLPLKDYTRVLVFKYDYESSSVSAQKGGPGGELLLFNSLLQSIRALEDEDSDSPIKLAFAGSEPALRNILKSTPFDEFTVVFIDQYSLESIKKIQKSITIDHSQRCRLRFLDFWGTPPEQNHLKLHPKQFLTPYPNDWNEHIGFIVRPPVHTKPNLKHPKPTGLLHGKLGRYFLAHQDLLKKLSQEFTLFATIAPHNLEGLSLPDQVINLGNLNSTAFTAQLQQSDFVITFGDPVLAPTGLQAIANGVPYLFARYPIPMRLSDLPRHPIHTQHDFLDALGAPYGYAVDMTNLDRVISTVRMAIAQRTNPFIPEGFSVEEHKSKVASIIRQDLCTKAFNL